MRESQYIFLKFFLLILTKEFVIFLFLLLFLGVKTFSQLANFVKDLMFIIYLQYHSQVIYANS